MLKTLRFITSHPLTRDRPHAALWRFAKWQVRSRLREEVIVDWIGDAKLAARNGMTGATGNIYCGLHEFADRAFVLHLLRPGDLFVDVGANVGSYTVLASKVCGARTIAVEPDPGTMQALRRNIEINGIEHLVETHEAALGAEDGIARVTVGRDTTNRVLTGARATEATREVRMTTLDTLVGDAQPALLKLDVEGFETEVLEGAAGTLAKPSLLAIETETDDVRGRDRLASAGFGRAFYDPASRCLAARPRAGEAANNALFVRSPEASRPRLARAPCRTVFDQLC